MQSIIDKYERNYYFLYKNAYKEWRLRSVIFKMKGIAKDIKRKKKLKKKIREKIARATLNNLKNKTAIFQSAHEFSYKIDKTNNTKDDLEKLKNKNEGNTEEINKKDTNNKDNIYKIKEEKTENNTEDQEQDDSESSFGLDD